MTTKQECYIKQVVGNYLQKFECLLHNVDLDMIERIAQRLRIARDEGRFVFVAGNGGSAATASHFVNDLGKGTKHLGCKRMCAMSLSDNVSCLTALANDEGYEHIFSGQLENFAQPGDVLVVISASGNSANLVQAVELAKARRLITIGLLGFDGGVLKDKLDECLSLPTEKGEYGLVESGHDLLCHILATCLMENPQTPSDGS